jgi:hypothetical protein
MIRNIAVLIALLVSLPAGARALTTEALLDSLQHTAFDYFWNEANPANGLIKDRSTPTSPCSIASLGFGLSAVCIGIDHGWVTRETGRARILTAMETLWNGPQGSGAAGTIGYKGFYYHFLDMNTATRTWDSELSTIDTALLFAGILDARQYFTTADSLDVRVRALADSITHRADWEFMRNSGVGIRLGWKPGTGFLGFGTWIGYNEAMIMYILALGSPTHPVLSSTWFTWVSGYNWSTQYGYTYLAFPPLFGHQYSHCWIDYSYIQDAFMRSKDITYFENSRRATYAQRAYCIANPGGHTGYGENLWGLTASDDPFEGYLAHGAPPPQDDNGTITPTAPASSIAFAPEIVIPVLHNLYDTYHAQLWSTYGFKDAFNLNIDWWATDYLGIDQGPIIIMIENYLNGSVWSRFMQNPDVQAGLQVAGFLTVTGVGDTPGTPERPVLLQNSPNPFRSNSVIAYSIDDPGHVSLVLFDVRGRRVKTLVDGFQDAGPHRVFLDGGDLPSGAYFYQLMAGDTRERRRCILLR